MNPHLYLPNQFYGQMMIYDKLVRFGEGGVIEPCLAERWDISDDGTVYTFHLRPGVKFSDGTDFDAAAVVKNFDAIMANRKRHSWQEITNKIEKWEATGPLTFTLTLSGPYSPALNDLSAFRPYRFLSPAAFPDDGLTANGIKAPIGTGPWKLVESVVGEYDVFERNELYWGPRPQADRVLVKVIPDPMTRAVALETGEIDLIYGMGQIGFDAFDRFSRDPKYITSISKPLATQTIAINTAQEPTNDLAVRKALQYITDREAIINGLFMGHQEAAYTLCYPGFQYCDIGLEPYLYDIELAKQTLENAGWIVPEGKTIREKEGKKLEFNFHFIGANAAEKALAEAFQALAARAGISIHLVGEEADMFLSHTREGNFNLVIRTTWGAPLEPLASLSGMRRPTDIDYHAQAGLADKPGIDEKIGRMLDSNRDEERAALCREILTQLHEEAVYIPIHFISLLEVHRRGQLDGVEFATDKYGIAFEKMTKQ